MLLATLRGRGGSATVDLQKELVSVGRRDLAARGQHAEALIDEMPWEMVRHPTRTRRARRRSTASDRAQDSAESGNDTQGDDLNFSDTSASPG